MVFLVILNHSTLGYFQLLHAIVDRLFLVIFGYFKLFNLMLFLKY